jgi:hypothetical protein
MAVVKVTILAFARRNSGQLRETSDSLSPGRDLNPGHAEYEVGVVTQPRNSVNVWQLRLGFRNQLGEMSGECGPLVVMSAGFTGDITALRQFKSTLQNERNLAQVVQNLHRMWT